MKALRVLTLLSLVLLATILWASFGMAAGQGSELPIPNDALSQGARDWLLALGLVVFLGVRFVQYVVSFLKVRFDFLKDQATVWLSLTITVMYVLFMFQPGVMNVKGLEFLPLWQAYAGSIVGIWLSAMGGRDAEKLNTERAAKEIVKRMEVVANDPGHKEPSN